jgi:hypothetical protein
VSVVFYLHVIKNEKVKQSVSSKRNDQESPDDSSWIKQTAACVQPLLSTKRASWMHNPCTGHVDSFHCQFIKLSIINCQFPSDSLLYL